MYWTPVSLDVFVVISPSALPRFFVPHCGWPVTVRGQCSNQSFPLRQCDLLLAFICVSVRRVLSFFMRSLSLDHGDLRAHRSFAVPIPRARIVGTALF